MKKESATRLMGIDYGSKRIGIAISDESGRFALPLFVFTNSKKVSEEIAEIANKNAVGRIIIGESKNYQGLPNKIYKDTLELKKKLAGMGFTVEFEPEFMTSLEAERIQGKNAKIDASAAAIILQSYLDRHHGNNT